MDTIVKFAVALVLMVWVAGDRSAVFAVPVPGADCPCPISSSMCACSFNSDNTADITCHIPAGSQVPAFDSEITICRPYYASKATFVFEGPSSPTTFTKDVFAGAKDYWTNINITRSPGNIADLSLGPALFTGQQINQLTLNGQIKIDENAFTGLITLPQELSAEMINSAPQFDLSWVKPVVALFFDLRINCNLTSLDDITVPDTDQGIASIELLGVSSLGTKGGSFYGGMDIYGDFKPVSIPGSLSFPNLIKLEMDARDSNKNTMMIDLTRIPKLEILILTNFFVSTLPVPAIQTPNNVLDTIEFIGLSITSVSANTFNNVPTLKTLNLNRCQIASLDPQFLNGVTNLALLTLSGNKLTDFPAISTTTIDSLDASKNQIKLLKTEALSFVTPGVLSKIDLSNNILTGIQSGFVTNLGLDSTINLSNNHLAKISQDMFTGISSAGLGALDLSKNGISTLGPSSFGKIQIRDLILANNSMTQIYGGAFTGTGFATGGISIDLSYNQLSTIPATTFSGITDPGLNVLNLAHNSITTWPQQASLPGQTRSLNLAYNQIQEIAANQFQNINAQSIILDGNPLYSIGAKAFAGNTLLMLSLQGNGEGIEIVDDTAFDGIPTLIRLTINIGKDAAIKLNSLIPADVSKTPLTRMIYTYQFMDSGASITSYGTPLTLNGTAVIGCADPSAQNICPRITTDLCTSFKKVDTSAACLCSTLKTLCSS